MFLMDFPSEMQEGNRRFWIAYSIRKRAKNIRIRKLLEKQASGHYIELEPLEQNSPPT